MGREIKKKNKGNGVYMGIREIIFRGKTYSNKWVYGYLLKGSIDNAFYILENVGATPFWLDEDTIGQYTGLTDRNGKKIFEGDIIKCKHYWTNRDFDRTNEKEKFLNQKIKNAYGKTIINEQNKFYIKYIYFRNYCIEYYEKNGRYRIRNGGQFTDLKYSTMLNHDIEVIGNIHDNPELLGE